MTPNRPVRLVLTACFYLLFGGYCVFTLFHPFYERMGSWIVGVYGSTCVLTSILLFRRNRWGRYSAYALSGVTFCWWALGVAQAVLRQPELYRDSWSRNLLQIFISLIPVFGVVGATFAAHKTLSDRGA